MTQSQSNVVARSLASGKTVNALKMEEIMKNKKMTQLMLLTASITSVDEMLRNSKLNPTAPEEPSPDRNRDNGGHHRFLTGVGIATQAAQLRFRIATLENLLKTTTTNSNHTSSDASNCDSGGDNGALPKYSTGHRVATQAFHLQARIDMLENLLKSNTKIPSEVAFSLDLIAPNDQVPIISRVNQLQNNSIAVLNEKCTHNNLLLNGQRVGVISKDNSELEIKFQTSDLTSELESGLAALIEKFFTVEPALLNIKECG